MEIVIAGFHTDEAGDWVAELSCGHTRHVRHNPPWIIRPWVITPEGRASFLGKRIYCKECDEEQGESAAGITSPLSI